MTDHIVVLARDRGLASDRLDTATEVLIQAIAQEFRAGREVNISAIARDASLSRQTIYNRLLELGVEAPR